MAKSTEENFEFFVLTLEDKDEIKELAGSFFLRNPICRGLSATLKNYEEGRFAEDVRTCLASGISCAVRDKSTGKLAGICLGYDVGKDDDHSSPEPHEADDEPMRNTFRLLDDAFSKLNVFDEPGVDRAMHAFFVTTDPKYERRGLGRKLIEMRNKLGAAKGCQISVIAGASVVSGRIFKKLGYKVRHIVDMTKLDPSYNVNIPLLDETTTLDIITLRI